MKNVDFVYDMRPQMKPDKDFEELCDMLGLNFRSFSFEDKHHYNLPIHSIKVGHIMYCYHSNDNEYYKIQLVHKYNGVHFLKWLEGPDKGKTENIHTGSLFLIKFLYPIKLVIPEGYTMAVYCGKTEIVHEYEGKSVTAKRDLTGI